MPDNDWGLSWSKRWHRVNPDGPVSRGNMPTSLCSSSLYLYTSDNKLVRRPPHIDAAFDLPSSAQICKLCDKKGRGNGSPTRPY